MSAAHTDLNIELGDDHVAWIEIARGPDNFIDASLAKGIADAFEALEEDMRCRVIVLASSGKHFCAGARLSPDASDIPTGITNPLYAQVARMVKGSIPIIAAVQGAAIGAGLGLALIADLRIATPLARFGATFARLGFHHGFGISTLLPAIVGEQRALEMLYTGRRLKGEEALAIGLCDRLIDGDVDALRAAARELAIEIAGSAPLALRAIRRTMRGALAERVRIATNAEHAAQQALSATADYREGLAASAERRAPRFVGR